MATTFSSVVSKPGRKVAAPKPQVRRNVLRPGLQTASTNLTPAPISQPTPPNGSQTVPETLAPAPPITLRTPSSIQLMSGERQTRQRNQLSNIRGNNTNEPPAVLPTDRSSSEVIKAVRKARESTSSAPAHKGPPITSAATPEDAQHLTKSQAKQISGRKRKAAELEATRTGPLVPDTESRHSETTMAEQLSEEAQTGSQATSDATLPSIETKPADSTTVKARRPPAKPRGQPRARKAEGTANGTKQADPDAVAGKQNRRRPISGAPLVAHSEADALLQDVTSQFSAVSRLAEGIDGTSRAAISARSGATEHTTQSLANALHRAAQLQTEARTVADIAGEVVDEALGIDSSARSKRKRRRKSPDDAEDHFIDPTEVKMADLTRDTGFGKKSGIELAMQNIDWKAVKQQLKEQADEVTKKKEVEKAEKHSGKKTKKARGEAQEDPLIPRINVVNGVIVAAPETREIDIRKDVEAEAARLDVAVIDMDKLTSRKNQNTIGRPKGLQGKQLHWTEEMDERFYKGIRMFGADMLMVSSLFSGMERRHIKKKFVREERLNEKKLREALLNPTIINAEVYQEETGMELGDPKALDEELKAMEADLRRRFEEELAEQQAGTHPVEIDDADIPLQSREQESAEPLTGTSRGRSGRSAKENRFDGIADDIVGAAAGPRSAGVKKGRKKAGASAGPGRKKKDGSVVATRKGQGKGKKAQASVQQLTGTVEEIGTVDEVMR